MHALSRCNSCLGPLGDKSTRVPRLGRICETCIEVVGEAMEIHLMEIEIATATVRASTLRVEQMIAERAGR